MKPLGIVGVVLVLGCAGAESSPEERRAAGLEWQGALRLEETGTVLNAEPVIAPDPMGGLIVVDRQERQVRLHDTDGELRGAFGREGEGPGEFEDVVGATRDGEGRLIVLAREGKMSVWSPDGDSLLAVHGVPARGTAITWFGDRLAIAATPPSGGGGLVFPVLYLLGPDGEVEGTLVEPHLTEDNVFAFFTVGRPAVEGLGARKAVTVPIIDSIWIVDAPSAEVVGKVGIPSSRLEANRPPVDPREDRPGFFAWIRNTWFVDAAYPLPGGGWVVSLWHPPEEGEEGSDWALVWLDDRGELVWESGEVPRLMTVDADGRLIFDDPESLFPGELKVGRLAEEDSLQG